MRDITNTYSFLQTRTSSPIDKEQPTCSNRKSENVDLNETISAMAGLVQETIDETREKAIENISEVAMEVLEFSVTTSEIDSMLDNEIQEIIDSEIHRQEEDTERMKWNMGEKQRKEKEKRQGKT